METIEQPAQLRLTRHYRVGAEKVWRAWTDPQALSQWFGPGKHPTVTKAEIDLRAGGQYSIAFNLPDGENVEVSGIYQEVSPHTRLVFSWAWKGTPERVSRVSIELNAVADGTEMVFVHDRFVDEKARANHERGWNEFFNNLDELMEA